MKINQFLLFGLILLIFFSCSDSNENKNLSNIIYATGNVMKIPIDNTVSPVTWRVQYYQKNNKEYIAYLNQSTELLFFNKTTGKIIRKLPLKQKEISFDGSIIGFHILNDSMVLLRNSGYHYFVIDWQGKLRNKVHVQKKVAEQFVGPNMLTNSGFKTPLLLNDSTLNVCTYNHNPRNTCKEIKKHIISAKININNAKVVADKIQYQDNCNGRLTSSTHYSRAYDGSRYVYSFDHSHNIHISNDNNKIDSIIEAKSKYFDKDFISYYENNEHGSLKNIVESASYKVLIYDKYRKCYYRFFYLGCKLKKDEDPMVVGKWPHQYSIIVLDEKFNKVGENLLDKNKYYAINYFVAPEGLYISTNHIKNPDFDEDYLKFELFELKEM